jgi:gelsolin
VQCNSSFFECLIQNMMKGLILLATCAMVGCVRQGTENKPVAVEDSNMALVGTDYDKNLRQERSKSEEAWKGVGLEVGMWIWRIEMFEPKAWPKDKYGHFYKGDCYIILHVTKSKDGDSLNRDIYFWLGKESSQDEQGTAAIKTVELDDFFGGSPIQHREVMNWESREFSALFPKGITLMEGGIDSGFDPADPINYQKKLFIVRKTKEHGTRILEIPLKWQSLNQGDCFVLDGGIDILSWCGNWASGFEKYEAGQKAEEIEGDRKKTEAKCLHRAEKQGEPSDRFWNLLGSKPGDGEKIAHDIDEKLFEEPPYGEGVLYVLHQDDKEDGVPAGKVGKMTLTRVADGDLRKDQLVSDDVCLVDTQAELFVWIGKGANAVERRNAMDTAILYLKTNNKPLHTPIHVFKEGQEITNKKWLDIFSN